LLKAEKFVDVDVCAGGAGVGLGAERLKAAAVGKSGLRCAGAGAGAAGLDCVDGEERPKRSLDLVGWDGGEGAEEKSPKSPKPLLVLRGAGAGADCFGGGAGFASKKLPPLRELFCRPWVVGDES